MSVLLPTSTILFTNGLQIVNKNALLHEDAETGVRFDGSRTGQSQTSELRNAMVTQQHILSDAHMTALPTPA